MVCFVVSGDVLCLVLGVGGFDWLVVVLCFDFCLFDLDVLFRW